MTSSTALVAEFSGYQVRGSRLERWADFVTGGVLIAVGTPVATGAV